MFDKLKVLAVLERANIQMSNFKIISTLAVLLLKNCRTRVGVNIPLVWRRVSWKVDVEFG